MFDTGVLALALFQQQQGWTCEELMASVEASIRRLHAMKPTQHGDDITRRHALTLLIGLPAGMLGLAQASSYRGTTHTPAISVKEMLSLYAVAIPACWNLYYEGGLAEVTKILPDYISQLTTLVQQATKYEKELASFASLAYQLSSLLALEQENFALSLADSKQGLLYAQRANDPNLQVGALIRQQDVFLFRNRPAQRLQTLLLATEHVKDISPLLRARIYSGLAEVYANLRQQQEALRYIGIARDTYQDNAENDPNYFYTHANQYMLYSDEGLTYLHLGKAWEAWQAFEHAKTFVPDTVNPRHAEILCWQALATSKAGDLERSCAYIQKAIKLASILGSDMYYSEADKAFQHMQTRWSSETKVKELVDLFQR